MTGPQSGADLMARIKPVRRRVTTEICLRPDLMDEWAAANNELADKLTEETVGRRRLGSKSSVEPDEDSMSPAARKIATRIQKLEAEIAENAIVFTFEAMSKDAFQERCDQHPPRKGDQIDQMTGYNRDAVLDACVRECLVDPVFEDCKEKGCLHYECGTWQAFEAMCNPSEWAEMRTRVSEVNGRSEAAPKSELASRVLAKRARVSRRSATGPAQAQGA